MLLVVTFLVACGQKGDLYMPEDTPKQNLDKKPKKTGNQQ